MSEKDLATYLAMAFYLKHPSFKSGKIRGEQPVLIPFEDIGLDNVCWKNAIFVMETIERYYQKDEVLK